MSFVIPLSCTSGSLTMQIYRWFRAAILRGAMKSGERLPATRELADDLHVSPTVVLLAYEHLLAEGFSAGRGGSGPFVSEGLAATRSHSRPTRARVKLSEFGRSVESAAWQVDLPGKPAAPIRYDFAFGRSDLELFP